MNTAEFVKACKRTRDAMFTAYTDPSDESAVAMHLNAAALTQEQRVHVVKALDDALTDAFFVLLLALDGAGSLDGIQQSYQLIDEDGHTISCGDGILEGEAYEVFHGEG